MPRLRQTKKNRAQRAEIKSVAPSIFRTRWAAFSKIRYWLPVQGGRIESNRRRH